MVEPTSSLEDFRSVLFNHHIWAGLSEGTVTVAFRRWKRPTVKTGGTLQSPGGLLAIDKVSPISPGEVNDEDALAAGYADREAVLGSLRPEGQLYRVRFHRIGVDPRIELRQRTDFDDELLCCRACQRRGDHVDATVIVGDGRPQSRASRCTSAAGLSGRSPWKLG
jgi:hypothetical protein